MGWKSNTTELQRFGWRLSAEQDAVMGRLRLAMFFEPCRLRMLADEISHNFFGAEDLIRRQPISFRVRMAATDFIAPAQYGFEKFLPIDAEPQFVKFNEASKMSDFNLFAAPLVRTEEIIVEPKDVAECLELIRKMQAPELQQVRDRNRQREATNQQVFHAQILSAA